MAPTLGTQATVDRLQAVDQLRGCTEAQLGEVARLAERVQVGEGEVLAREGRIGREFFLILSGTVAVTQGGRRVNTLGPGDFFGELAAMNPGPRNATVTAMSEVDVLDHRAPRVRRHGRASRASGTRCSRAWRAGCARSTHGWPRHVTDATATPRVRARRRGDFGVPACPT